MLLYRKTLQININVNIDVSVIIVNYNTLDLTKQCINSIKTHTRGITYEIIIVDNASEDGSQEYFQNDNSIIYIYNKENLGFGRANNIGYKKSSGKYIFLLNSDTILKNNSIKMFFDYMELNSNVGCTGCLLLDTEKKITHSYGKFLTIGNVWKQYLSYYLRLFYHRHNKSNIKEQYQPSELPLQVDYITGADLFIRRSVIETHGLFDERFFMYFEDTYLQHRYSLHGIKSVIINGPEIIHLEGGSRKLKSFNSWLMGFRSEMLFLKLTLNKRHRIFWRILTTIFIPPVIIIYPSAFKDKAKAFQQIFCVVFSK